MHLLKKQLSLFQFLFFYKKGMCKRLCISIMQKRIQDPATYLSWSLSAKIVNGLKLLTIFVKKLY